MPLVLSRAFRILNSVINLSPAKLAIAVLASGAMLIINNWDDVAPVIKEVWQEVDSVAQAMGDGKPYWVVLGCT